MPNNYLLTLGGIALLAGAGLEGSCISKPEPLAVEYAGCAEVRVPGPVCVLPKDRELRLWAAISPGDRFTLQADGKALAGRVRSIQRGRQWTVQVPAETARLTVHSRTADGREAAWNLALAAPFPPSAVDRAGEVMRAGDPAAAERLLAGQKTGKALGVLARAAFRRGDAETAAARLHAALAAHRAAGELLSAVNDGTMLVFLEIGAQRFAAARRLLHQLSVPRDAPAEAAYYLAYYQGLLADRVGDARSALDALSAAASQAERAGMARERGMTEELLGLRLQALGRSRDAAALFARLERGPDERSPCDRARLLANRTWSLLLAREAGESLPDPTPLAVEVQEILARESCARPDQRVNAQVNLALAHLQAGRLPAARTALAAARALAPGATLLQRLWGLDIEARIALQENRPQDALERYDRLAALAESTFEPEVLWQAVVGRARALTLLGRTGEALDAYARAESLLAEQSLQIPLNEGRDTFVARREMGTRFQVELLLASGQPERALEVVRRARARVLRQLARGDRLARLSPAEQDRWDLALERYRTLRAPLDAEAAADWQLSTEQLARRREERALRFQEVQRALDRAFEVLGGLDDGAGLPPIRPGDLVLAYHPLPEGWVGFAASARGISVHRFELPPAGRPLPPRELSQRLLLPFHHEIAAATRLRILPYGRLREVDFHALPFGTDVLLAARPVVYGLDLETRTPASLAPRQALVVADPQGDLPASRTEAAAVISGLRRQRPPWKVEQLAGQDAASAALQSRFGRVSLLHYAGHGTFAGFGGWESALPLAGETRLLPGDLLALDRVPDRVVLSGCDTGKSNAAAPVEGLGLAQAFLLAGARSVLATTRPVGDHNAAEILTAFYRSWDGASDPASALRQALLLQRRHSPGSDWAGFRLFEP